MSKTLPILNQLKAEILLGDSHIVNEITALKKDLRYASTGDEVSFDDYFLSLQGEVDNLNSISLLDRVPSGTESEYSNQLISLLESIQDDCERVEVRLIKFQGQVASAQSQVEELSTSFEAWFSLAAQEVLKDNSLKLPNTQISAIARSEFARLMDRSNIALGAIIEAVKVERQRVQNKKKMAQKKFELGKEQVNAAWTNKLPGLLGINPNPPDLGLRSKPSFEPEEEESTMPSFVSKYAQVGINEPHTVDVPCLPGTDVIVTTGQGYPAPLTVPGAVNGPDADTGEPEIVIPEHPVLAPIDVLTDGTTDNPYITYGDLPNEKATEESLAKFQGVYKVGDAQPATVIDDVPDPDWDDDLNALKPEPREEVIVPPRTASVVDEPAKPKRRPLVFNYDDEDLV